MPRDQSGRTRDQGGLGFKDQGILVRTREDQRRPETTGYLDAGTRED